jgi:PmbA protein
MPELSNIVERIVGEAGAGEQLEAVAAYSRDTEVRVYEGEIEQFASAESQGVGIRVIANGRQGFAYAGSLDEAVIAETLAEARDNATFGSVDEFLGLAEPDGVAAAELDLYKPELASVPTEDKIALAIELERATRAADARITGIETAEYADVIAESAVATSTGVSNSSAETGCYLTSYALATEGDETQTGFGFSVGRSFDELDAAVASSDAAERATRLLGAVKPASERLTVVLDPFVTAQFLSIIASTFSGEAVLKGYSLFADRLGESVAGAEVTLVDDPTDPEAFSATAADGEGLATRRNPLIEGGVVQGFVHNTYTGRRSGAASTGSAVRGYSSTPGVGTMAVALAPGKREQDALIADVDHGVLIQGVSGLHSGVNPVSGDFSTGADGLMIRNGALAEPVREFTIASTLLKMLNDIIEIGGDVERLPMSATGLSLVIGDVTVSGS